MTLADRLHERAAERPDRPALRLGVGAEATDSLTYGELDARVRAAGAALLAVGLQPGEPDGADLGAGDRVGVIAPNGTSFVEALFGAIAAALVPVPINAGLTAREITAILADADVRAVVAHRSVAEAVAVAGSELERLAHVVVVDDATTVADAVGAGTEPLTAPATVDDEQLGLLAYTAGTTGEPKGAMLRHRNLLANHRQLAQTEIGVSGDDVVLAVLPLFHIYALNVALAFPLARGATVVIGDRFDPEATLRLVADERVSVLPGAPPMFTAWNDRPEDAPAPDLHALRFAVSGAAPLAPVTLRHFVHRYDVPLYEGYGLTETAPVLTTTAVGGQVLPGSVGQPLPEVELRLVGDDGQPVRAGDPGEVLARGPNVFAGYWRNPTETAQAFVDGWFATGDIGYVQDGALHLVDRKRDLVIVSGFNVFPREVEDVLVTHPKVALAAVIGVPDPTTGEAVKAFVQAVPGEKPTSAELHEHCRTRLARFKCPSEIAVVEALPISQTGKVTRRMLRDDT